MTQETPDSSYQVLARKYRPQSFQDLIGQDGLVNILTHALETKRLPHALILTGVRGVGKTTTARLLAKCLNCVGPDGKGMETLTPCGVCPSCQALASESLMDVIEMDAASRTGVDDVREIIETACYKPLSARYKVYIIDEVHMLSKSAFNALLKTLEEPPAHVKFIFATTEIHKVPETVLSRCMKFDLQRVKDEDLVTLMQRVVKEEGLSAEEQALSLIARAGKGSARDSLSLLDQALSLGKQSVTTQSVRDMLHLADQTEILTLLSLVVEGKPSETLNLFNELYQKGSDPHVLVTQLLEEVHWIQTLHFLPSPEDTYHSEETITLGKKLAQDLSIPVLARLWQSLVKGAQEIKNTPDPFKAAHMVLIRLCYLAELPTPGEILSRIEPSASSTPQKRHTAPEREKQNPSSITAPPPPTRQALKAPPPTEKEERTSGDQTSSRGSQGPSNGQENARTPEPSSPTEQTILPQTFENLLELVSQKREALLLTILKQDIHILDYQPGFITLYLTEEVPKDFMQNFKNSLKEWTKWDWQITVSKTPGAGSLHHLEETKEKAKLENLKKQPLVKEALKVFPGAEIKPYKED